MPEFNHTPALTPHVLPLWESILDAAQPAEELGGPNAQDYITLMFALAEHFEQRARIALDNQQDDALRAIETKGASSAN